MAEHGRKALIGILTLILSLFPVCPGGMAWAATGDCESVMGKTDTAITSIMGKTGSGIATIMGKNYTDGDGGTTYPDILFWLNFEANDTTGDYNMAASECAATDGDTSGAYTSGATISSATHKVGSYALSIPTAYDGFQFAAANIVNTTEGRIGFWINRGAARTIQPYMEIYVDANNFIKVSTGLNAADIEFQYKSGGTLNPWIKSDTTPISESTWYFVEIYWKSGASGLKVNGVSIGTDADSFSAFDASSGVLRFSSDSTDYQYPYFIDNFIISNDSDRDLCGLDAGECKGLAIAASKPSGACP